MAAADIAPGPASRGPRRAAAAPRRPARRRSQLPFRHRHARAQAEGRASQSGARVRRQVPSQPVRRRDPEQPRVRAHRRRRGCGRGCGVPRDPRSLSGRPLCRARGVEGRVDGVSRRPLHRRAAVFRQGLGAVSALGLSAVVAVLVRHAPRSRPATSRPASRGCAWPPPIITTRITAGWRCARLKETRGGAVTPTLQKAPATVDAFPPPTASRRCCRLGSTAQAMDELLYAQRMWGDSPQLQATIALTHRRLGNVRAGINAMKRAYPQYLAAGGETLPTEILQVIFPVDYWPLLQKYSKQRGLDPFVVAALVAQESNFDPRGSSHANAYGLMQILPEHRPAVRAQAGRPAVLDAATDRGRRSTSGSARRSSPTRSRSSAACISRWRPITPATAACCAGSGEAGAAAGRIHRRHPVPRDAELREADPRHRRGLPVLVRSRALGCDSRRRGDPTSEARADSRRSPIPCSAK